MTVALREGLFRCLVQLGVHLLFLLNKCRLLLTTWLTVISINNCTVLMLIILMIVLTVLYCINIIGACCRALCLFGCAGDGEGAQQPGRQAAQHPRPQADLPGAKRQRTGPGMTGACACACACVCACACARARACMCAHMRVCACVHACFHACACVAGSHPPPLATMPAPSSSPGPCPLPCPPSTSPRPGHHLGRPLPFRRRRGEGRRRAGGGGGGAGRRR